MKRLYEIIFIRIKYENINELVYVHIFKSFFILIVKIIKSINERKFKLLIFNYFIDENSIRLANQIILDINNNYINDYLEKKVNYHYFQ